MVADSKTTALLEYKVIVNDQSINDLKTSILGIPEAFQKEFDRISGITWDEFKDYSLATSKDVSRTWESTTKEMKGIAGKSLWGAVSAWFEDDMDQVEDIWDNAWQGMIGSADKAWNGFLNRAVDRAWSGLGGIFDKAVLDPATDWLSGALGLSGVDFNFTGKLDDFLGALDMGDTFGEALSAAGITDIFAGGGLTSGITSLFGGSTAAGSMGPGMGGAMTQGLSDLFAGSANYALTDSMANSAALFDFGSEASSFSGAIPGLAATMTPMGLALGLGGVGMMLGQMGFLTGTGMTPEEAKSNWQGQQSFLSGLTGNMNAAGQGWPEVGDSQFALFGQAARDAAEDLERLRTVAGYTQEQLDAVVASLDPLAQEMVTSGQAAGTLEGQVRQLAQEMNAAANSYAMTDQAAAGYNQRIDALAQRLGLTGGAVEQFRKAIWGLADEFSAGGEGAQSFGDALDRLVSETLGGVASAADTSRQAVQGLVDSLRGVSGASAGIKVENLGDGTTRFTATDYAPGGQMNEVGLYTGGGGGVGDLGIGSFHQGGLVRGWPRAHAGALISSLARNEVPLIARRGEYVVRAESVTAATLPALKALNQGGAAPQAPALRVNLHVEIHGNFLGREDNLEDLARIMERKLRELEMGRWRG